MEREGEGDGLIERYNYIEGEREGWVGEEREGGGERPISKPEKRLLRFSAPVEFSCLFLLLHAETISVQPSAG